MSQVDARSFLELVTGDPGLQQAAMIELEGKTGSASKRLIELGGRHGLTFNEAELRTALEEQRQAIGEGELSDTDLDGVAGGGLFTSPVGNVVKAMGGALSVPVRKG